jgi:hypothetical protein
LEARWLDRSAALCARSKRRAVEAKTVEMDESKRLA